MGLKFGVIGPAGFSGSYLSIELINRGHNVRGISRKPEKLGLHQNYKPYSIDIDACTLPELIESFRSLDVLVNAYGPHTGGEHALQYKPFVELTRKIVIAAREAKVGYLVMIGGCGSLHLPGNRLKSCLESKPWWLAYRRGIADSDAHVAYMEERLGTMGSSLRNYRNARILLRAGKADEEAHKTIEEYEKTTLNNDNALTFVTACRTTFMFFDGNTSFKWTFVSPPALYRSGKKTGKYETIFDQLPVKPTQGDPEVLEGRLHGITAADLACAIADEAEAQTRVGRHWSAFSDMSDDTPTASYVKLS